MLSQLFLGLSLIGAEWVLYLLLLLSVISVALIFERVKFYREASQGLVDFRHKVRTAAADGNWEGALQTAQSRAKERPTQSPDLESQMALALLASRKSQAVRGAEVLNELAQDSVMRAKLSWEKNLSILATIGANAPFVGLFGTVLGIIKAFHDLSHQTAGGAQGVTAGISEALVATAVGLLVAIPAVVAFNLFQRRVKSAVSEAEALKCFLVGRMSG